MKNELSMPKGCTVLEEEEMNYVEGGGVSLSPRREYLNKSYCLNYSKNLISRGMVKDMTPLEVAQEIYAHTVMYYAYSSYRFVGIGEDIRRELLEHANPIDIEDGGDSFGRKAVYGIIWNMN